MRSLRKTKGTFRWWGRAIRKHTLDKEGEKRKANTKGWTGGCPQRYDDKRHGATKKGSTEKKMRANAETAHNSLLWVQKAIHACSTTGGNGTDWDSSPVCIPCSMCGVEYRIGD